MSEVKITMPSDIMHSAQIMDIGGDISAAEYLEQMSIEVEREATEAIVFINEYLTHLKYGQHLWDDNFFCKFCGWDGNV